MKQKIYFIMIIQFLIYFGFSMVIPVLPELVDSMDISTIHMGTLLAVYSISSFLSAPFFGKLSDTYGRRPVLIYGLSAFSFSFLMFAMFIDYLWILYISRIIGGAASGALYTATTSMVADITTKEERTKYMGLIGMSIGLGFIFGPGIGGILASFSLSFAFFMTSLVLLVAMVFSIFKIKETYQQSTNYGQIKMASKYFLQPIGILFVTTLLVMFTMSGMESTFQLLAIEKINITPQKMGILFFIGGIFNAFIQGVYIRSLKDGQEKPVIIFGQFITVIAFILLPFMTSLLYAGVCIVLLMSGNALVKTLMTSQITKEAPANEMGLVTSTTYSMDSLGRIFGPIVFNILLLLNLDIPFWFGACMTVLSTFFILQYYKKKGTYA